MHRSHADLCTKLLVGTLFFACAIPLMITLRGHQGSQMHINGIIPVPYCKGDWYTYRLRFTHINSTNCLTELPDGTLEMQPCAENPQQPDQNFFLQTGGSYDDTPGWPALIEAPRASVTS